MLLLQAVAKMEIVQDYTEIPNNEWQTNVYNDSLSDFIR